MAYGLQHRGSNARGATGNGFLLQHKDFIPCLAEPIGCATPITPAPTTITSGWFVIYTFLMLPQQCSRSPRAIYQHYNDIPLSLLPPFGQGGGRYSPQTARSCSRLCQLSWRLSLWYKRHDSKGTLGPYMPGWHAVSLREESGVVISAVLAKERWVYERRCQENHITDDSIRSVRLNC